MKILDLTPVMRRMSCGRLTRSYFASSSKRRQNVMSMLDGKLARTLFALEFQATPEQVTQLQVLLLDSFKLGFEAGIRNQP